MSSQKMSVEQKYTATSGRVFLSGNQALVKLVVEQQRRDEAAGLKTGGFVSGYRGSPLGHLDQDMWSAKKIFDPRNIRFQPGVNEDMAATAIWGSQQTGFFGSDFDGVFGLWYGKGPGVDRSGDALRHANLWGTSAKGGVVMAVGDDPMSRSSSIQQGSEHPLMALCIPVFNASNVQDIYDYGLYGYALSRYAGVWTAVKAVSDTFESWYPIDADPSRVQPVVPADHEIRDPGVHIRWPDRSVDQDERMLTRRLPAVLAFVRANKLNRETHRAQKRRLGIITTGKSYVDLLEAMNDLGIDQAQLDAMGLSIFKVAVTWPLEPEGIQAFVTGLEQVLLIEEGRPVLEPQVKSILYPLPENQRPRILGKQDGEGRDQLPSHGEVTPASIARVLQKWLQPMHQTPAIAHWIELLDSTEARLAKPKSNVIRTPYFCSGCPHNTSTKVPEGSDQLLGIGCHWLATLMDRKAISYPQMGGEGATWVGAAPFVKRDHIFVNVGDGTYYHSGSLAIRQAIAGKVNITYKVLYNDAVAMTGGQPVDGPIGVVQITHELHGEGAAKIVVVSSEPSKWNVADFAPGTTLRHRDELDTVQKELREVKGVTVIIYEQTCATELRRRRSRKLVPTPTRRVFINDRVCEGCGDCGIQSNCLSVQPLETEYGRKRVIDQSACNLDYSCLKGFCPSFVTVEGGALKKGKGASLPDDVFASLPVPAVAPVNGVYGVLVAGIGGTGVVTISTLLGIAAELEDKHAQQLDLTGMAQKFGAVYCHLKVAERIEDLNATRLSVGQARLMIGADIVTAGSGEALSRLRTGVTSAVVNDHETVTGAFTRDGDFHIPQDAFRDAIREACGEGRADFFDSTELSRELTGDTIGANVMLLGFASQKGLLPVALESLEKAIEINGVAVPYNLKVFNIGRLLAADPQKVKELGGAGKVLRDSLRLSETLDELIQRRVADLTAYQDGDYAQRYLQRVNAVRQAEARHAPGRESLTRAVAANLYKMMAIKDEFEVARLFSDGSFEKAIADQFEGDYKVNFHLAPPLLAAHDPDSGRPKKKAYGPWMGKAMKTLSGLRGMRGGILDVFSGSAERKHDLAWLARYEAAVDEIVQRLGAANYPHAFTLAGVPDKIRGFGPVREKAMAEALPVHEAALAQFRKA